MSTLRSYNVCSIYVDFMSISINIQNRIVRPLKRGNVLLTYIRCGKIISISRVAVLLYLLERCGFGERWRG